MPGATLDVGDRHHSLGHRPGLVEDHGVDLPGGLEGLVALEEDPRAAPARGHERAVGVARPSAHGQAMIRTEMAALNAGSTEPPISSHAVR